jgi:hypothetical protein
MKKLIERLMSDGGEPEGAMMDLASDLVHPGCNAGRMPKSVECQLVLKSGYAAAGVLTTTPEDTLRLLSPAKKPDGSTIIADHYFDYDDVLTIVIGRDMPASAAPHSGLIIGH